MAALKPPRQLRAQVRSDLRTLACVQLAACAVHPSADNQALSNASSLTACTGQHRKSSLVNAGRDGQGGSDSEQTEVGRGSAGEGADSRRAIPATPPALDGSSSALAQQLAAAQAQVRAGVALSGRLQRLLA